VSDVDRACDFLIVLVESQVQVAGDIGDLLDTHHRLTGPRRDEATLPGDQVVITASHTDRQSTYVVRTDRPVLDPAWEVGRLDLEDLVLAYMSRARPARPETTRPTLEALR
jgi:ABC-2 type transport system ATP-binding protein